MKELVEFIMDILSWTIDHIMNLTKEKSIKLRSSIAECKRSSNANFMFQNIRLLLFQIVQQPASEDKTIASFLAKSMSLTNQLLVSARLFRFVANYLIPPQFNSFSQSCLSQVFNPCFLRSALVWLFQFILCYQYALYSPSILGATAPTQKFKQSDLALHYCKDVCVIKKTLNLIPIFCLSPNLFTYFLASIYTQRILTF